MNITDTTVFIPGATSGIGLALALRLQERGSTVIIGGRRRDVLADLAAQHGLFTVHIDITDHDSVLAARDQVLAEHPQLNALIAMAGIMRAEDVRSDSFLEQAMGIVDTNIAGPLRLISAFIDHLQAQPRSTLVTVSSGLAHVPLAPTPTYNGSKAFIHRFSESIRLQLADSSVQVIEIVPPAVRTELMPGHAENDAALPLDDFADEVMHLLETQPEATEILVERVKFLRYAEVEGRYAQAVEALNP